MPESIVNGHPLYYQSGGSGAPLLLVHGTMPDANVWGGSFDALARGCRVVAYDRRGFARSGRTHPQDFRAHAEDAAGLLAQLDLAPAAVLGWSWGGIVALEMAAAQPDRVDRLILVEPALHLKKHPSFQLIRTILGVQLRRRLSGEASAVEGFFRWACGYAGGGNAYDAAPAAMKQVVRQNAASILSEIDAGTGESLTLDRIHTIRCPVTVLVGTRSQPEFRGAVERLRPVLPQAEVVSIEGAGHMMHLDRPDAFNDAVLNVVAGARVTA